MSESPEEQPSTGVLGRIGSWFSPWRAKGPKSPSENASPTSDQPLKSEREEESEESVKPQAREQPWEEEKDQSSHPSLQGLSRDIFPCEEEDATQSAHREGSVVSSTQTVEGGPREEEFVECRKKRIGQGKQREESRNGTSAGGSPEKNASHLTHLSSSSEQGVVWDSDQAHTHPQAQRQAQAQTSRRLHVYLEETSVSQYGQDTCAGQEVVRTKVTKHLKVLHKAKSSPSFDLPNSFSSTSAENKKTNVKPAVGTGNYYSALVGVSLKSHKGSQLEPVTDKEQTEADSMGRKNATRRRVRKNSQGDGGNSPREKTPPNTQPVPEGLPTSDNSVTCPLAKSPKTDMGESSVNSTSKHNPPLQASPEGGESKTSCADTVKQLDNFQDSNSTNAATLACVVDGDGDMEDDDSLYKVERKTETPESKRRSIKVSRSEVKLFTKNVPLSPKQSPAGDNLDFKPALKNTKDEAKDKPKTETDARLNKLKKIDEEPAPVVSRIADKISLFERPAMGVNKQTSRTPRSADVSPARKATERLNENFVLSDLRSRSAERYSTNRSSSASPVREKLMTIRERAMNFTEASKTEERTAQPQKPDTTGMSQKPTSSVAVAASKIPEPDSQGKLDTRDQTQAKAKSETTLQPDGQDTTTVGEKISTPREQPTDSKTKDAVASKTAHQGTKPSIVSRTDVPAKGSGDSAELTNNTTPLSKGPSRTGSRSKRRKSREPTSPISPNSENKPDCFTSKPEATAVKHEQVDDAEEATSASKQVSLLSDPFDEAQGNTSDKQSVCDTKQKAFKKELAVLDKHRKQLDSSYKKENIDKPVNRQEELPEPSVNKDEPDTAAWSSGTKMPIDKDAVILPQKEEKAGEHSLVFTQEREKVSEDSRETSASSSSPTVERPIEKTPSKQQEPPAEDPKLDTFSRSKSKVKLREPNKKDTVQTQQLPNTELINQAESKDMEKFEKVENKQTKLVFTQEMQMASKDSRKSSASFSPMVEQPTEKSFSKEQAPPVEHPKIDKDLPMQSEPKLKEKLKEPNKKDTVQTRQLVNKDTELINQAESKDVEKFEKVENKQTKLVFTQETQMATKDSRKSSASFSPEVDKPTEKTYFKEQAPPVEHPKLDKDLPMQSEPKLKEKVKEPNKKDTVQTQQLPNKDTELINQAEGKDMEKFEKVGSEQTKLVFTQETQMAPKDSRKSSASFSPMVEQPTEKSFSKEQAPPVEHPKIDKDLPMQSEPKLKEKVKEPNKKDTVQTQQLPNKDTELINQAESKDVEKFEKVESQQTKLVFTQETQKATKDSRKSSASFSPEVEKPTEKTSFKEQGPPVEHPKLDKDLPMQSEPKIKEKVKEPNKKETVQTQQLPNTELINQAESKDVEKFEKVESEQTNHTEKKDKDKPQQLLPSDKNTSKGKISGGGQGISGTEGSVVRNDESKNAERKEKTQPVKDITKPEANQTEPASDISDKKSASSDLPAHTQQRQTTSTHPQKAACSVTQTNEAVIGTKRDKGPSKGEMTTNVPPELQTKSPESPAAETEPVVIAAEPQPNSVSVEKTENLPDDSCAHGANDAEFSSSEPITKATAAVEEATVKAANDTPALITAQAEKESSVKEPTPVSVSKSVSREAAGKDNGDKSSTVKSLPPDVKILGGIMKLTPQCEESENPESTSDNTSLKGAEETAQRPSDSAAICSRVNVAKKTAEKTFHSPMNELSPVANGEISPHPHLHTVKKETVKNKPRQTPKASTSPEVNKLIPDSIQRSSMKKLNLPWGLSKDDSATQQDAPSSWLDVDFPKQKIKVPAPKLSSSGSESNLLDTSGELDDDDKFIEKINKLCAPFSLPPRKHNILRPPQPAFAMPAIKEDRFEKTFDPEEFQFGLRKKNQFTVDTTPTLLGRLQNKDAKSGLKPARASLADRSMLLSSLDTHSRLRNKTPVKDEEDVKEEKDDQIKVKSRLEGSCVLSRLTSSSFRAKRNGDQTQAEGTNSGDVSPSDAPHLSPPPLIQPPPSSPTATAPLRDPLDKQSPALSNREEAQSAEAVVSDSGPPLPSFNDIKLPDYLEKYLPGEPAKPVQSIQGQEQVRTEVSGKMTTPACGAETDLAVKPGPVLPDAVPPCFPEIPSTTHPTLTEIKQPPAQPQGILSNNIRTAKGFHKRPGKMLLFEEAQFSGQPYEICRDVADATSLQFSPLISVKVIRGCWVLYEKPDFQGRSIALEEGAIELTNEWAEPGPETEPHKNPPMRIGSIRLAVCDYSIPHIDLFTEPEGLGRVTPYNDDTIETGSFGVPLSTASIQVHSGVWLVFSDPGFQGMLAVLETGEYPFPETWGFPSPFVGSLRPLKMGGFKVENPSEVKAVLYEKPGFEGSCLEIDSDVFSFSESEGDIASDAENLDSKKLKSVGSLKIIGGFWVGYSQPGFEGQQHILEEGEYLDCSDWGGSEPLLSLQPILADFMSPHLKMFSNRDFDELGVNIDLTVPVINMDDTGYGMKTQSIDVLGGVWVVFEEPGFCGEPYILEKGLYGSPEDWGALQPRVASAMPVVLEDFENAAKFKVQLFSDPGFQGSVLTLEDSTTSLQDSFSVASCKFLAGSWLAFEGRDFTGRMYVLEVGSYPDLRAMGCSHASSSILSLQTVGYEFSLPSITLFERCGLRGKRVVLTDGSVNLQLAGGCSRVQSVLVEGGMWVLYEGINYRGAQILLKPGEVPDWRKLSSWQKIGSLRPLIQKQVHFRLRNRQTGLMMSVTGDLDDVKLLRIQETEEADGFEQIWFYQNGHLHCKLLEECRLSPIGSVTMAGSRLGLTPDPTNHVHLWSITPDGFICHTSDLVLDVKGGHNYDKKQVILNTLDPNKLQQRWNVEII